MNEAKDWYTTKKTQPKIVCLCGSTRFKTAFERANFDETLAGHIVLMPGHFTHAEQGDTEFGNKERLFGLERAAALDELYRRKIDLADEVFVLNVNGYIGSSTKDEIEYAKAHNKPLRYLQFPFVS